MNRYYYKRKTKRKSTYLRVVGIVCIALGVLTLLYFFFPLVSWELYYGRVYAQSDIEFPIPEGLVMSDTNLGNVLQERLDSLSTKYEDARNWYPKLKSDFNQTKKIDVYYLSIPKLKIVDAVVSTRDYDLSSHLVQYFGTATPGEPGTAVIFGHSSLPQLFNAKNYKTIFSTLHTLRTGDEIFVGMNGISYKYKIFSIAVTSSHDTSILSELHDNNYITLITCTPPGTVWKRLVVRAKFSL